jgi:hypothetical protein
MLDAPSEPDPGQYAELGLRFVGVKAADSSNVDPGSPEA